MVTGIPYAGEAGDVCMLGLVCSIPGVRHRPWLCWRRRGSQAVISCCTQPTSVRKSKKHVRGNGGCVLASIWGITLRHLRMAGFESS